MESVCSSSHTSFCAYTDVQTRMLTLKFLHKIDKTVYTLDGHGVVQAGPNTADRAVAFDAYDAAFSGSFHKSGIQFGGIGTEGHIHKRTAVLPGQAVKQFALIQVTVKNGGLFLIQPASCFPALPATGSI